MTDVQVAAGMQVARRVGLVEVEHLALEVVALVARAVVCQWDILDPALISKVVESHQKGKDDNSNRDKRPGHAPPFHPRRGQQRRKMRVRVEVRGTLNSTEFHLLLIIL